jgi:hypothetical protein
MKVEFTDAQKMHRLHPSTFQVPSPKELEALKAGDYVKVCAGRERFWVQITSRSGIHLYGNINNDLIFSSEHGLFDKDYVGFEERHVYAIFLRNDDAFEHEEPGK